MFDITEPPLTADILGRNPDPYKGQDRQYLTALEMDPARIREQLLKKREMLKKKSPAMAEQIDAVYNLYYSFCLLSNDQEGREVSVAEKTTAARIQQTLVHHAFFAGQVNANAETIESVYRAGLMMERAAHVMQTREEESQLAWYWLGIKRELGTAKSLVQGGYTVWLPDYRANPDQEDDEVLQLDVFSGVDMIAQKDNRVLLIDVQGRKGINRVGIKKFPEELKNIESRLLRRTIWAMDSSGKMILERVNIIFPDFEWKLRPRDFFGDTDRCRQELQQFCQPDPMTKRSIIQGLERTSR